MQYKNIAVVLGLAFFTAGCAQQQAIEDKCTLQGCTMHAATGDTNELALRENNPVKIPDENLPQKNPDIFLQEKVAPAGGVVLPVKWGDVLVKAVKSGAIDLNKYMELLGKNKAKLTPGHEKLLREGSDENISFSPQNAYFNLNMLWALGLVNKNPVLTDGKISEYGEKKKRFVSIGGWGLGSKKGADLFAIKEIITLTEEQQRRAENAVMNTYRPCCDNHAGFPDCNHGMASLALAELMASQGSTEEEIYKALLVANSYWFTASYVNIARYLEENGADFEKTKPKEILDRDYSSRKGYSKIKKSIKNIPKIKDRESTCAN